MLDRLLWRPGRRCRVEPDAVPTRDQVRLRLVEVSLPDQARQLALEPLADRRVERIDQPPDRIPQTQLPSDSNCACLPPGHSPAWEAGGPAMDVVRACALMPGAMRSDH